MKRIVFVGIWLLLLSSVVQAEKMYVSDHVEITLRTGKGIDHKIISMIHSGEAVEVIEPSGQWTKIRTASGREGWVLSRFLKSEEPSRIALEKLKKNYEAMMEQVAPSLEEIKTLKEENQQLRSDLARSQKAMEALGEMYETLKKESAEFLKLKTDYHKIKNKLGGEIKKAEKYENELTRLEQRQIFRWILTGAGIMLLGFLIGFSAKHQRRRSSLL
ncbi:MAG: TIGR04211 family SH3 domain-containing protein [Deltaproteobacteria bacterium]|nr:TIGR04211 family SH3 domain-containing protein [Deltaproteobacteria bacterium]